MTWPSFSGVFGQDLGGILNLIAGIQNQRLNDAYGFAREGRGLQNEQFGRGLTEEGRQFDVSAGLDRSRLGETGRQFDATLGFQRDESAADRAMKQRLLNQQIADSMRKRQQGYGVGDIGYKDTTTPSWTQAPFWSFIGGYSKR